MYTTTDENGIINNFAKEPKMYLATEPSSKQKRGYLIQGTVAGLFVTALVLISVAVS
jgi:hypothetical protein